MPTHRTRPDWITLVAAYRQSGLSSPKFAAQAGVNASTLSWWAQRLRAEEKNAGLVRVEVFEPPAAKPQSFVHATVGPAELRFTADAAPAYLGELVAAISRATRC